MNILIYIFYHFNKVGVNSLLYWINMDILTLFSDSILEEFLKNSWHQILGLKYRTGLSNLIPVMPVSNIKALHKSTWPLQSVFVFLFLQHLCRLLFPIRSLLYLVWSQPGKISTEGKKTNTSFSFCILKCFYIFEMDFEESLFLSRIGVKTKGEAEAVWQKLYQ